MKVWILILVSVLSLSASIESEVDKSRFSWKNGVFTDSFAGMQWQDNEDAKTVKKDWDGAKEYCSNLVLSDKQDWRLPSKFELTYAYEIGYILKSTASNSYWSSLTYINGSLNAWSVSLRSGRTNYYDKRDKHYVRCVRGKQFDNSSTLKNNIEKIRLAKIYDLYTITYTRNYNKAKKVNTVQSYKSFIKKHPKAPQVKEAKKQLSKLYSNIYTLRYKKAKALNTIDGYLKFLKQYPNSKKVINSIYILIQEKNNIEDYSWFIKKYPRAKQSKKAVKSIYILIQAKNNIEDYGWFIKKYSRAKQSKDALNNIYTLTDKANNIAGYEKFIKKYPKAKQVKDAVNSIYTLTNKKNNIVGYEWFIKTYPRAKQSKDALNNIYALTNKANNIAGYEWFIKTYPKAPQMKEAIHNMHKLAFAEAKKLHTLSAYNTFIISYPYAKELKEAVRYSTAVESGKYKKIKKDDERKARLLAVKIKKMVIQMKKQSSKYQMGYEVIIDRMSRILTEEYEETDASLRYYESKEFTDFASKFDKTMSNIQRVLNAIERNTRATKNNTANLDKYAQQMIQISQQGFASAKADRDMVSYHEQKKTDWDKYMHFRDKGYN